MAELVSVKLAQLPLVAAADDVGVITEEQRRLHAANCAVNVSSDQLTNRVQHDQAPVDVRHDKNVALVVIVTNARVRQRRVATEARPNRLEPFASQTVHDDVRALC